MWINPAPRRTALIFGLPMLLLASTAGAQDMANMPGMGKPNTPPAEASPPKALPPQRSAPRDSMAGMDMGPQDMGAMPGMEAPQRSAASTSPPKAFPPRSSAPGHIMPGMDMEPQGMMAGQLGAYAMTRDASGTSWQPESSPMEGAAWKSGDWTGMVHGYIDAVYDRQTGPRGGEKAFSESMLMVMAQHAAGPGTLTLRSMLSLDPAMGPDGYPLLLQTGETANGVTPLVDRQHPHDLFMELAGAYSLPLSARSSAFLYVGYPGEPALGPVTFMHRLSGMDDPAAPITHHWLDSTHITDGVITTGLIQGAWKIEGSVFTGREPNQYRWDLDPIRLDSYSGRISWNPSPDWALQASYGYIHSPEQLAPNVSPNRLTVSATYNRPLRGGNWQTTLAWGRNDDMPGHVLDGVLLESALSLGRQTIFSRVETVRKDELFQAPSPLAGQVFRVSEATLGYVFDAPIARHVALGFGVQGTVNIVPSPIRFTYGAAPLGYMPFLRLKII